jgi:hypothetical protein
LGDVGILPHWHCTPLVSICQDNEFHLVNSF